MVEKDKKLVPYKIVKARQWRRLGRGDGKNYSPSQISAFDPAEDEGDRGSLSRREGRQGGHHRSRLFQRRPAQATKDAGKIAGPRGAAHHQRADRGALAYGLDKKEGKTIAGL
jgi:molecular chaperone DnaK